MKEVLLNRQEFLEYLGSNKFIRNVVEKGMFIYWQEPHPQFFYIQDKKIETFVTPKKVNYIHKLKYGKRLNAKGIDLLMMDLGFEPSKIGSTKVYDGCFIHPQFNY